LNCANTAADNPRQAAPDADTLLQRETELAMLRFAGLDEAKCRVDGDGVDMPVHAPVERMVVEREVGASDTGAELVIASSTMVSVARLLSDWR
jgi:hypothetical protein